MSAGLGGLSIAELFNTATGAIQSGLGAAGAVNPLITAFNQVLNRELPVTIPTPDQIIKLYKRNAIKAEQFDFFMKSWGIGEDLQAILLDNLDILPGINETVTRYRRGLFSKDSQENSKQFINQMYKLGVAIEAIPGFLEASEQYPNVELLMRWVHRDIFDENVAKRYKLDENLTEFDIEWAQKLGVNEDIFRKYWRGHWTEPDFATASEMFQRLHPEQLRYKQEDLAKLGIRDSDVAFEKTDLDVSLKHSGIMPHYRQLYEMIQYKPMGRLDIRRLDKIIDLDPGLIEYLYREIGYSPNTAKTLVRLTKIINTLGDITDQLKQKEISYDQATAELVHAGATPDQAKHSIDRLRRKLTKTRLAKERDISESIFKDAYKVGLINREEFVKGLEGLNYDATEAEFIAKVVDAELDIARKKKLQDKHNLTKSDVITAYKTGKIDKTQAMAQLVQIGYDNTEASYLISNVDQQILAAKRRKEAKAAAPPIRTRKDLGRSDMEQLYKLGIIPAEEAINGLVDLGYSDDDAKVLILTWDTQLANKPKRKK